MDAKIGTNISSHSGISIKSSESFLTSVSPLVTIAMILPSLDLIS